MKKSLKERIENVELMKSGRYIGGNGLLHCARCNKPLQRRVIREGQLHIEPVDCACEANRRHSIREKRREDAFISPAMAGYRYDSIYVEAEDVYAPIKKFIRKFEKMKEKNVGLYLYGDSEKEKNFHTARIANALIDRDYRVKNLALPLFMSLQHRDLNIVFKKLATEYDVIAISSFYIPIDESDARFVFSLLESLINAGVVLIISSDENIADVEPATYFGQKIKSAIRSHCIPIHLSGTKTEDNLKDIAEKKLWIFGEDNNEE